MRDQFEAGDTVQFTFVCSVAPDSAPYFAVFSGGIFDAGALINSATSQQSSPFSYYAMHTMPQTGDGVLGYEFGAVKTVEGTPYPFIIRRLFNVQRTRRIG